MLLTREQLQSIIDEYHVDAQWIHTNVIQLTPQEWKDLCQDTATVTIKGSGQRLRKSSRVPAVA